MKKLCLALILLTACTRTASPTQSAPPLQLTRATFTLPAAPRTPFNPPGTTPLATPLPPLPLTIPAPDGVLLAASFYPPAPVNRGAGQKAPGVLLLHMLGGSRADW